MNIFTKCRARVPERRRAIYRVLTINRIVCACKTAKRRANRKGMTVMKKRGLGFSLLFCVALGLSSCADKPEEGGDVLAGTSWIAKEDGSQWVFGEDGSFHWYQSKEVTDDNYYAGAYEFHMGRDAMDYLTGDLSDYGVTEEEMQGVIDRAEEYTLEDFVCFSTVNQSFLLNGEEQLSEDVTTSYFGFLLQDGNYLDIANMITGTYYGFTKEP